MNVEAANQRMRELELDQAQREAAGVDAEGQDQIAQSAPKKVKISFDEYQRISTLVVGVMKEFEA